MPRLFGLNSLIAYDYSHMEKIDLAQFFESMPNSALSERRYDKGDNVFQQGGRCRGLWFVRQGRIDLQRVTDAGHPVLIHRALEGEVFGEASLFSASYHCAATAASQSILVEANRSWILDTLNGQPDFALRLCAMLAGQVQSSRRLVEVLSVRKAEERVFLAAAHGMLADDIKAFSTRIGLTHEAVYRALATLTEQGRMIKSARGQYALAPNNAPALRH